MLASHASGGTRHQQVLRAIGLEPMIWLDMRLGEGTGAVLMMHLVEAAILVLKEMATFSKRDFCLVGKGGKSCPKVLLQYLGARSGKVSLLSN